MVNPVHCQSRLGNVLHQSHWSDFVVIPSTAKVANWYTGVREMRTEKSFKLSKVHLQMAEVSICLIPLKTIGV